MILCPTALNLIKHLKYAKVGSSGKVLSPSPMTPTGPTDTTVEDNRLPAAFTAEHRSCQSYTV